MSISQIYDSRRRKHSGVVHPHMFYCVGSDYWIHRLLSTVEEKTFLSDGGDFLNIRLHTYFGSGVLSLVKQPPPGDLQGAYFMRHSAAGSKHKVHA